MDPDLNESWNTFIYKRGNFGFAIRDTINWIANRMGMREQVEALADIDAVRFLQEREGYTPCYGREVALWPGRDGTCEVNGCCWRNYCEIYRTPGASIGECLRFRAA